MDTKEIIFSEYQAQVFNQVENAFRTNGYLGTPLFEDTYVLSKAVAELIIEEIPVTGTRASVNRVATEIYQDILDIAPVVAPTPPPAPGPVAATTSASDTTQARPATTPTKFGPPVEQPKPTVDSRGDAVSIARPAGGTRDSVSSTTRLSSDTREDRIAALRAAIQRGGGFIRR